MSDGLITVESRFPVSETIDRLAAAATAAGLLVFDLFFRALARQDEHGRVRLTWNDAHWLAQRHGLSAASASAVQAIGSGANRLAATAAGA